MREPTIRKSFTSDNLYREEFNEGWVTLFGFSRSDTGLVLAEFRKYGAIEDVRHPTRDGNWINVKFKEKNVVQKVLSKNGTRIGLSLMIGVVPCKDPSLSQGIRGEIPHPSGSHPGYSQPFSGEYGLERVLDTGPQPPSTIDRIVEYVFGF
eukprot:TRINITY_DN2509_c0_g1_i10.p1 TRINITY_DN2509_c0_g1~~TRINITY_DN2509_c0_g1_i10.p1  ORF type:complete len:151 (-),score=26.44 TRINITY_DN2509_c0_g1_i10:824-1276(-)